MWAKEIFKINWKRLLMQEGLNDLSRRNIYEEGKLNVEWSSREWIRWDIFSFIKLNWFIESLKRFNRHEKCCGEDIIKPR